MTLKPFLGFISSLSLVGLGVFGYHDVRHFLKLINTVDGLNPALP